MLRIEIGCLKSRLETLQHYQHILDVEQYVLERRQQVEIFVEMVKSEAENTREQCKQKIEKVRDFLGHEYLGTTQIYTRVNYGNRKLFTK